MVIVMLVLLDLVLPRPSRLNPDTAQESLKNNAREPLNLARKVHAGSNRESRLFSVLGFGLKFGAYL